MIPIKYIPSSDIEIYLDENLTQQFDSTQITSNIKILQDKTINEFITFENNKILNPKFSFDLYFKYIGTKTLPGFNFILDPMNEFTPFIEIYPEIPLIDTTDNTTTSSIYPDFPFFTYYSTFTTRTFLLKQYFKNQQFPPDNKKLNMKYILEQNDVIHLRFRQILPDDIDTTNMSVENFLKFWLTYDKNIINIDRKSYFSYINPNFNILYELHNNNISIKR